MAQVSGEMFATGAPPVIAKIKGEAFTELPRDLYIPPDALTLFLQSFEGPFDLLLYLIRRQRLDLNEISVAQVTDQYMVYVEEIRRHNMQLASDYLAMAAELAAIKSRLLLPRQKELDAPEDDPTARILAEVAAYEKIRLAAGLFAALPKLGSDFWVADIDTETQTEPPEVLPEELARVWAALLAREGLATHHTVRAQELSVHEMMSRIIKACQKQKYLVFLDFMKSQETLPEQIVAFLAVLELVREGMVDVIQACPYAPIYLTGF
ncbi:MAG TPA: segregation/condensation protein A [Sutterella sp.]|nr:segregation/condensation protein A [Sutterella sp.]